MNETLPAWGANTSSAVFEHVADIFNSGLKVHSEYFDLIYVEKADYSFRSDENYFQKALEESGAINRLQDT